MVTFGATGAAQLPLIVAAVIYGALGLGLLRGLRGLACLTFVVMLIGISAAIWGAMGPPGLASWLFMAILMLDLLIAAILFLHIWRR